MSNPKDRHRGQLFDNRDKKKPSQPDMQGKGFVAGKPYAITAWKRQDQLVLSFAPPRTGSNTYPPEELRGTLDPAEGGGEDAPVWTGDITGDDGSFDVSAFETQGKSGMYLTLQLVPSAAV